MANTPSQVVGYPTIRKGSKSPAAVKRWQGIIGVNQDGNFGATTEAKTKEWQRSHGLTADGVVGHATWDLATRQQNALPFPESPTGSFASPAPPVSSSFAPPTTSAAPQSSSTPFAPAASPVASFFTQPMTPAPKPPSDADVVGRPVLRKGSTATSQVRLWQRIIGVESDGIFGSGTESATRLWQTGHGLPGTGIVDAATWAAAPKLPIGFTDGPLATTDGTGVEGGTIWERIGKLPTGYKVGGVAIALSFIVNFVPGVFGKKK